MSKEKNVSIEVPHKKAKVEVSCPGLKLTQDYQAICWGYFIIALACIVFGQWGQWGLDYFLTRIGWNISIQWVFHLENVLNVLALVFGLFSIARYKVEIKVDEEGKKVKEKRYLPIFCKPSA